jgi:hypothetical protein
MSINDFDPMRATSNHGHVGGELYAHPNVGYVSMSNHGHVGDELYAHPNVGYTSMAVPGSILGYSKDGYPIRAASAPGTILGYSKDGYPIRAASVIDDMVCGGSSLIFVGLGLILGWLATEKISEYVSKKR